MLSSLNTVLLMLAHSCSEIACVQGARGGATGDCRSGAAVYGAARGAAKRGRGGRHHTAAPALRRQIGRRLERAQAEFERRGQIWLRRRRAKTCELRSLIRQRDQRPDLAPAPPSQNGQQATRA